MQHSASPDHSTSESRRRDQWESVRLFGGIAGLILVLAGVIFLAVLATVDIGITSRVASGIAACVAAIVGGGLLARTCFGSQRAADRTAAFMSRLDVDDARLDELYGELAELRNTITAALLGFAEDRAARERFTEVMERFMAHEEAVDGHSAKARNDVALILDLLAKRDLEEPTRYAALADRVEEVESEVATLRHAHRTNDETKAIGAGGMVARLPLGRRE